MGPQEGLWGDFYCRKGKVLIFASFNANNAMSYSKYVFSGHESFPCKSLWLKKGYDFVVQGKDFNSPEAVIDLGVGKNMVASIRYWLRVIGVCDNDQPTWLGNYLFNDENGKDVYIEDLATLWLLHFHLVFNQNATLYNLFFCSFQKGHDQFGRDQVVTYIKLDMIEANKQKKFLPESPNKLMGRRRI